MRIEKLKIAVVTVIGLFVMCGAGSVEKEELKQKDEQIKYQKENEEESKPIKAVTAEKEYIAEVGEQVELPKEAEVTYSNGKVEKKLIKWSGVPDTSKEGRYIFEGSVEGTELKVSFTLFVKKIIFVKKPNIYLYPEKNMKIDVTIEFEKGGEVVKSIPEYGSGWKGVTVERNGTIDGKYGYLFYESKNSEFSQYKNGWSIKRENLVEFFEKNMKEYGFNEREVKDFIEYWIPKLNKNSYYEIYPQTKNEIEKVIKLKFSTVPDSLLRVIYSIKGAETKNGTLKEPVIERFERKGFTVTEWGVITK